MTDWNKINEAQEILKAAGYTVMEPGWKQDRPTYAQYYAEIASLANEATIEAFMRGEDISDVLHKLLDGHQFVIYTAQAIQVLAISSNDGYGIEEDMIDPSTWECGIDWSGMAYWAMHADVTQHSDYDPDWQPEVTYGIEENNIVISASGDSARALHNEGTIYGTRIELADGCAYAVIPFGEEGDQTADFDDVLGDVLDELERFDVGEV